VIVSLKFPEPKTVTGYDFALRVKGPVKTDKEKEKKKEDEEVTEMLYKNASVLAANNIPFAFTMGAKGKPQDLLKNVRTAVEHGLSETDALKALTINAARILSADRQIGSIEKGKIANLVITEGNIFDKKSKLKNVFIDGKKFDIKEPKKKENKNKKSD
ncbi:amidohydrolase family protein, partial [bacterium]|nr:amidohydrolase family protein [bacterium]